MIKYYVQQIYEKLLEMINNFFLWSLFELLFSHLGFTYPARNRLNVSRFHIWVISLSVRHVYGPKEINAGNEDVIVVCHVKNGEEYLDAFVEHYNQLGVKHIVFLDNNSQDRTIALASKYKNISVFFTRLPYRTYARNFMPYLEKYYPRDCWGLAVDIDEFFDYPFSRKLSLKHLLRYLNRNGYNAVLANMLELFSNKPLNQLENKYIKDIKDELKYYDLSYMYKRPLDSQIFNPNHKCQIFSHGIRYTVFGYQDRLYKFPLVFYGQKFPFYKNTPHTIKGKIKLADFSCVLFHLCYAGSFRTKCKMAVKDKSFYDSSIKYRRYLEILESNPDLNIHAKARSPQELKDTDDLIYCGFLCVSDNFKNYVREITSKEALNQFI